MEVYNDYINSLKGEDVELSLRGEVTAKGGISGDSVNGFMLAEAIGYFSNQGKKVKLIINSTGGAVIPTLSVVSAIEKHSVSTHVEGVAFSSAGLIAMSGTTRTMNDHGLIMVHSVRLANGKKPEGAEANAINAMNSTLKTLIDNRTTIGTEAVAEMVDGERFLDASEAIEYGMVDEVLATGKGRLEVTNSMQEMFVNACKLTNVNNKNDAMEIEKLMQEKIDLQNRFDTMQNKFSDLDGKTAELLENKATLEKDNKALSESVEKLTAELDASKEAEATALLNSKNYKLEGAPLAMFINMYKTDKEGAIGFISAMPVSADVNLNQYVNQGGEQKTEAEKLAYYQTPEGMNKLMAMHNGTEVQKREAQRLDAEIVNAIKLGLL